MRRTAVYFCLGVAIFAALLPCAAIVSPPSLHGSQIALENAGGTFHGAETESLSSPLLARITPRHLARASLPSSAA